MFFKSKPATLPSADTTLPGRDQAMPVADNHYVNGQALKPPYPAGSEVIYFGMGCFWGAERLFWQLPGVTVTAVGYQGGQTPNPNYAEVCSGQTGHTEAVMVVFDPQNISLAELLKTFWEGHDPTQGMRQGNDAGTQYRSATYFSSEAQAETIVNSRAAFATALAAKGLGPITTEMAPAGTFYFAETDHQQYLAKNPDGYCGLGGTGVTCPIGMAKVSEH